MKKTIMLIALLLATSIVYWGCSKKEISAVDDTARNAKAMEEFNALTQQIADAKSFFTSVVDTNAPQKFKKTALWDEAYIAYYKEGERIIVPLHYDKNYTFKTSTNGNDKLSLAKNSRLHVYKDATGNYKYEIMTEMLDASLPNAPKGFTGIVTISNWADKILRVEKYLNNKKILNTTQINTQTRNSSTNNGNVATLSYECSGGGIEYYWCDEDAVTFGDCAYLYSVCYSDIQSDDPNGANGSYVDSSIYKKPTKWLVAASPNLLGYWEVWSYDMLTGIKIMAETGGGHFTEIVHTPTTVTRYSPNFLPTYTKIGEFAWIIPGGATAKSNVAGSVYNDVIGTFPFDNTKPFIFSTYF